MCDEEDAGGASEGSRPAIVGVQDDSSSANLHEPNVKRTNDVLNVSLGPFYMLNVEQVTLALVRTLALTLTPTLNATLV